MGIEKQTTTKLPNNEAAVVAGFGIWSCVAAAAAGGWCLPLSASREECHKHLKKKKEKPNRTEPNPKASEMCLKTAAMAMATPALPAPATVFHFFEVPVYVSERYA